MEQDEEDDALMTRLQQGDTSALAPLYRRHRGVVTAVIRRQVTGLSASDAEDLSHETFLELVKIAGRYRPGLSLKGWLCGIALKKAWRRSRGEWVRSQLLGRFTKSDETSEDVSNRVDAARVVNRRLAQLPPAMREVVVLCLVEGVETSDAAVALGISVNTVWTRLHRAREKLRELEEAES